MAPSMAWAPRAPARFVAAWQLDLGRGAIDHRVRTGRLHVWYRGVYPVGHRAVRREGRWMAAVLAAGPRAVLSHRSAAGLWGIRPTARTRIEVTVPIKRRSLEDIQVHCARLAADEKTNHDGIPVTTPARTLVDVAAVLSPSEVDRALNHAEILRLPFPDLARYAGHSGIAKLRRAPTGTRNDFEAAFLAFVKAHDLPTPLVNRALGTIEPDFRWPAHKVIVELDGFETHGTRRAFERDRERDRRLHAAGWRVVRMTWRHLHEQRAELANDLHTLLPRLSAST
jgi:very-short-patch-repair endonuclease